MPLDDLPTQPPAHAFLGFEGAEAALDTAGAVLLPVPWESTVSYGQGTRRGPAALLEASGYVELYDQELDAEPGPELGVHTLPPVELPRSGAREAMEVLERSYAEVAEAAGDRFLVLLGGEHAVSSPAILVQARRAAARDETLSVLQLDAHADLRATYHGTPYSHASAMARVLPEVEAVVGVGLRGVSAEELAVHRADDRSTFVWADEMQEDDAWMDRALDALGETVYLTFDVDYFDPSLMPSTGTPEPGGGRWYPTLRFLRRVFRERRVVAADVVELAPVPGLHAPDFLAAKLVYKLLGYHWAARGGR